MNRLEMLVSGGCFGFVASYLAGLEATYGLLLIVAVIGVAVGVVSIGRAD